MTNQTEAGPAYGPWGSGAWGRGGCGARRGWRPVEILGVVLGFAVWWPLGLAALAYTLAQRKGYPMPDVVAAARSRFGGFADSFKSESRRRWRPFESSGNAAFDEWRKAELDKLEEQRRKLDEAEREFAEHMNNLRRARDREEFERFMAGRRTAGQA